MPTHETKALDYVDIDVNGVRVAVTVTGDGEPLIFLHGAGIFHGFDYVRVWAQRFRVFVPLHPGFGASADDPTVTDIDDLLLHYLELFDRLGLKTFRLVGFSFGGWIAARLAILDSRRIDRLVLGAPAGLRVMNYPAGDLYMTSPRDVPAMLVHRLAVLAPFLPKQPDLAFAAERYRESLAITRVGWSHRYDRRLTRWLGRIRTPTLIIWGKQDRLVSCEIATHWQSHIPGAQTALIEEAGHLVFDESTEAVERAGSFLSAA